MEQSKFSAIQAKSLDPESDEEDQEVDELLDNLKDHLKECQKLGKYVEAQMTQNRIAELKEKKSEMRISKLQKAQEKELKMFQETYAKDKKDLQAKWQKQFAEHEQNSQAEENALREEHEQELNRARTEAAVKIPEKVHVSHEIVALKKMELALASQGKFEEAHATKMEVARKEQEEQNKWDQEREEKIMKKLQVTIARQNNELQAMALAHEKARNMLEKTMNEEFDVYVVFVSSESEKKMALGWKRSIKK